MVNRTLQAKTLKLKRQKKARPRYLQMDYGYMKARSTVDNKARLPPDAQALFAYANQVKVSSDYQHQQELVAHILQALYPHQFELPAKAEVNRHLLVVNGRFQKVALVSNGRDCFAFFEWLKIPGIARRSITYSSLERAMAVFKLNKITWKETIHVPNVEPPAP